VGGIAIHDDQILLIKRGRGVGIGLWSIPGGRVEFGETLSDAVVREFHEETGLNVRCDRFVDWVERIDGDHHFVIADFFVTVVDGTLCSGDDAADARWISRGELGSVELVHGLLDFLDEHSILPATIHLTKSCE
jgi:8-oxo-dGTP diphosphatase